MRALIACVLLAGCITDAAQPTPPVQLVGCWVNGEDAAASMRWGPDPTRVDALRGVRTIARRSDGYSLEPSGASWKLCRTSDARCWEVARGSTGSLEGGRVFIDTAGDSLRLAVAGDGPEVVIFEGRRSPCR